MSPQSNLAAKQIAGGAVDWTALSTQIGNPGELAVPGMLAYASGLSEINSVAALRDFVNCYIAELLIPYELPAIYKAYGHGSRGESRELIALDNELTLPGMVSQFAAASRQIGRRQLDSLKPLKDERVARKYREAVERGEAKGWHTLVYGLILSIYSLPLRQGLTHYGQQTVYALTASVGKRLGLPEENGAMLPSELAALIPAAIEKTLAQSFSWPTA